MQVQRVQTTDKTTFGTALGRNLCNFIRANSDGLTEENMRYINRIRHNGSNDTFLELEFATKEEQEKFNYIYKLNLHSDIIDRKNNVMRWCGSIYREFQDFITGKYSGQKIVTDNRFPIPIKNLKDNTYILVAKQFEDSSNLAEKIQEEVRQSEIAVEEYNKFEKDYINKIKRNK